MGLAYHTLSVPDWSVPFLRTDRIIFAILPVSYSAGGSAGAAVTTAYTFPAPEFPSAASYSVFVGNTPTDVTAFITAASGSGFTLNVEPRLAANTVAAGTVNVLIIA